MTLLNNSDRSLLKATYVPLKTPAPATIGTASAPGNAGASDSAGASGSAVSKATLARGLRLQAGEIDRVRAATAAAGSPPVPEAAWQALKQFEPAPVPVLAPKPSVLANVGSDQLLAAGRAVLAARTQQYTTLMATAPPAQPGAATAAASAPASPPAAVGNAPAPPPSIAAARSVAPARSVAAATALPPVQALPVTGGGTPATLAATAALAPSLRSAALAASAVTSAAGAINAFENAVTATPIGMLHLERVEMAPAGVERGELVATIPLAPGETTSVIQKEWAVTSQEFSSIVTDQLENYSEKGVTEKTELADSTESQTKRSQQLGLNASVSGSYGFVTFAASANFSTSSSDDESKKQSRSHTAEVTEKASSRVRKEHKVTIQTSSVTGSEQTSTRTLTNPSATDTMRIDYFSMMRKWRVRLLRYGVRMTYDLAIPEPGATLRALHAQLADLNAQLSGSFAFNLDPAAITDENDSYVALGAAFGTTLDPPPAAEYSNTFTTNLQNSVDKGQVQTIEVEIPDGFEVASLRVGGLASANQREVLVVFSPGYVSFHSANTNTDGLDPQPIMLDNSSPLSAEAELSSYHGMSGHLTIPFFHAYAYTGSLYARVAAPRTAAAFEAWRLRVWQALYSAARDAYYASQQLLTQQRDALKAEIENVDTLTLRREEREEVMKGVLRWLLGPEFDFMPQDVQNLFVTQGPNVNVQQFVEKMAEWFVNDDTHLTPTDWSVMYSYGEMVKFIMEAIEWENLLYLLYPYFWDIPLVWDFVRRLQHSDPTREDFLRAGSARVVLTIRPGWEADFLAFLENGELGKTLSQGHPYLTIGDEMRAYANTNYPGIPPANPESSVRPQLTPKQRTAWQDIQALMDLLDQYSNDPKNNSDPGNKKVYPTTAQGLAALSAYGPVPKADPWGNAYQYTCPGQYGDYDLSSLGADGVVGGDDENADITSWATASLIGEWYEYTPTHGLDIAVTSQLQTLG